MFVCQSDEEDVASTSAHGAGPVTLEGSAGSATLEDGASTSHAASSAPAASVLSIRGNTVPMSDLERQDPAVIAKYK